MKTRTLNGQTLEEVFLTAGAKIGEPSCAACLGGPSDTFGRLNTPISCISTTNRNFPGRMGHKEAQVFLASPLTVAASAHQRDDYRSAGLLAIGIVYMPDYDAGFKIVAREAGLDLARLGGVEADVWEPITGEVHAAERLADRAFRAENGDEKFIVYMEAYTRWHRNTPWSVLAKSGLLSERERIALPQPDLRAVAPGLSRSRGYVSFGVSGAADPADLVSRNLPLAVWYRNHGGKLRPG